jgi:hypothetical protein
MIMYPFVLVFFETTRPMTNLSLSSTSVELLFKHLTETFAAWKLV